MATTEKTKVEMTEQEALTTALGALMKVQNAKNLRTIADTAMNLYKKAAQDESDAIQWKVGMRVVLREEYRNRKPYGAVGTVNKVNRTKLVVAFDNFATYRVSSRALELATKGA